MKPLSNLKNEQVGDNPLEETVKEKGTFHLKKKYLMLNENTAHLRKYDWYKCA